MEPTSKVSPRARGPSLPGTKARTPADRSAGLGLSPGRERSALPGRETVTGMGSGSGGREGAACVGGARTE